MNNTYKLIKDGKVENTILADEQFIELIRNQYDSIELVEDMYPPLGEPQPPIEAPPSA